MKESNASKRRLVHFGTRFCSESFAKVLAQPVIARPSMRNVPSSFPWCDLKSKRNKHQVENFSK